MYEHSYNDMKVCLRKFIYIYKLKILKYCAGLLLDINFNFIQIHFDKFHLPFFDFIVSIPPTISTKKLVYANMSIIIFRSWDKSCTDKPQKRETLH